MDKAGRNFKGKRVLVTGGFGFLGSNLVKALSNYDCEIVRLGKQLSPDDSAISAKVVDFFGDVRSAEVWEEALRRVDIVFHLAAQTSERVASVDVSRDFDANVRPIVHLLEVCRRKKLHPAVFFAGSITQVGVPDSLPFDEKHTDNPITTYDLHKLLAEEYLKYYIREGVVTGAVLRLAYVYGPGPKNSSSDRGVLNQMIAKAVKGKTLSVWGRGNYIRDYIFVGDVVRAFLVAAVNISKVSGRHFVIGTGKGHTISEAFGIVSQRVGQVTGKSVKVTHKNSQKLLKANRHGYLVNPKLFMTTCGWKPNFSLESGIDETIKHLVEDR